MKRISIATMPAVCLLLFATTVSVADDFSALYNRLASLQPGEKFNLSVLRAGKSIELTIAKD